MGSGLDLAVLGNKAELGQLQLELGLNLSLEDFPTVWGRGGNTACVLHIAELGHNINGFCHNWNQPDWPHYYHIKFINIQVNLTVTVSQANGPVWIIIPLIAIKSHTDSVSTGLNNVSLFSAHRFLCLFLTVRGVHHGKHEQHHLEHGDQPGQQDLQSWGGGVCAVLYEGGYL